MGAADASERSYWLDLFSPVTWKEFLDAGGTVSGFRENRWNMVQRIRLGDYLLCYLTGVSRFVGILEVVSEPFRDAKRIWKDEQFPSRVRVKALVALTAETAVPIHELQGSLSIFRDLKSPAAWTGHVRGSPAQWKPADGEAVVRALFEAQKNPVRRPVDKGALKKRPKAIKGPTGPVTVPEADETGGLARDQEAEAVRRPPSILRCSGFF